MFIVTINNTCISGTEINFLVHLDQTGELLPSLGPIGTKLSRNVPWMVLYKVSVFRYSRIFNMAARANNMFWLSEIWKIFFSETNELTEPKLNDHWNVLYQFFVFYADRKSKMAAIAGQRLTLDPMGKCSNAFFSETTNMIKAKLYMNVHWMVLYKL